MGQGVKPPFWRCYIMICSRANIFKYTNDSFCQQAQWNADKLASLISVSDEQLLPHICSGTFQLTLQYPLLMCTAGADGVHVLTNTCTHTHRHGWTHTCLIRTDPCLFSLLKGWKSAEMEPEERWTGQIVLWEWDQSVQCVGLQVTRCDEAILNAWLGFMCEVMTLLAHPVQLEVRTTRHQGSRAIGTSCNACNMGNWRDGCLNVAAWCPNQCAACGADW